MVDQWYCNFAVDLGRSQVGRRFLRSYFHGTIFALVAVAAVGDRFHSFDTATGTDNPGDVAVAVGVVAEVEVELVDGKAGVGSGTRVVVVVAVAVAAEHVRGKADAGFGSYGAVAGGLGDDDPAAETDQLRLHCSIVTAAAGSLAGLRM